MQYCIVMTQELYKTTPLPPAALLNLNLTLGQSMGPGRSETSPLNGARLAVDLELSSEPDEEQHPQSRTWLPKLIVVAVVSAVVAGMIIGAGGEHPKLAQHSDMEIVQESGVPTSREDKAVSGAAQGAADSATENLEKARAATLYADIGQDFLKATDAAMDAARPQIKEAVDQAANQAMEMVERDLKFLEEKTDHLMKMADMGRGPKRNINAVILVVTMPNIDTIRSNAEEMVAKHSDQAIVAVQSRVTAAVDRAGKKAIDAATKSGVSGMAETVSKVVDHAKTKTKKDVEESKTSAAVDAVKELDKDFDKKVNRVLELLRQKWKKTTMVAHVKKAVGGAFQDTADSPIATTFHNAADAGVDAVKAQIPQEVHAVASETIGTVATVVKKVDLAIETMDVMAAVLKVTEKGKKSSGPTQQQVKAKEIATNLHLALEKFPPAAKLMVDEHAKKLVGAGQEQIAAALDEAGKKMIEEAAQSGSSASAETVRKAVAQAKTKAKKDVEELGATAVNDADKVIDKNYHKLEQTLAQHQ